MPCCYAACGPTDHRRASDNSRLPRRRHSRPTSSRGIAESTDGPRSSHLAPARQGLEQLTKPSAGAAHAPGHRPMQTRTPSRLGGFMNVRDSRDEPPQQRLAVGRIPGSLRRDSNRHELRLRQRQATLVLTSLIVFVIGSVIAELGVGLTFKRSASSARRPARRPGRRCSAAPM